MGRRLNARNTRAGNRRAANESDQIMGTERRAIRRRSINNPILLAYLGLSLTMVVWSLVPVFLKKLLVLLSPTELTFSRFLGSGTLMLAWVLLHRFHDLKRILRSDLKLLLLSTVFGPLTAMLCLNFALLNLAVGTVAVFAAIEPLCTYAMAVAIGQEVWQARRMASIGVAMAGIALVTLSRESVGMAYWVSIFLAALSPVIWSVNNIITKDLVARHSPVVMMAAAFVISSLFLIPTLSSDYVGVILRMDITSWMYLSYCIMGTMIGFSIWYWSLRFLPPSTVAVFMYILPVFSVLGGILLLGETLSWLKATGMAAVLIGLYLVNVRFR